MTKKRPLCPIHPGEVISGELEELDMTPAELARTLHVSSNLIYQMIAANEP